MANLKLKNPAGGSLNLVSADGASDLTVTFPATTGTAMVSGNMPAFSAVANSNQTISAGAHVKLTIFGTENFDTNNNFASNRFTPTVAGYYQISCAFGSNDGTSTILQVEIWKNGSTYALSGYSATGGAYYNCNFSTLVYCNGSTDYIEFYGYSSATAQVGGSACMFTGCLVRAA
jgi:hypothetical protein